MSKAPETIYLQIPDDDSENAFGDFDQTTWCAERINDSDIAYVHHSIAYGYASEVERLRELEGKLRALADRMRESRRLSAGNRDKYQATTLWLSEIESLLTPHQIETMARDALTKEG